MSGKIFCGLCDSYMNGHSGTSKTGKIYYHYHCRNKDCRRMLRKDYIEKLVVDATTQYILIPNNFNEIAKRCIAIYKEEQQVEDKTNSFEQQFAAVKYKIDNVMKAIEAGIMTDTTKSRLTQLENDKQNIVKEMKTSRSIIICRNYPKNISYIC
nr:zinc ribbon domain-containing protein [Pectinatus sottacetonis]